MVLFIALMIMAWVLRNSCNICMGAGEGLIRNKKFYSRTPAKWSKRWRSSLTKYIVFCVKSFYYINFNYFLKNIQSEMGEGSQTSEQKNATDKQRGNKLSSDGQQYDAPRPRDRPKKRSKRVSYSYVSCSVRTSIQVESVAPATTIKRLIVGAAISSLFGVLVPRLPQEFCLATSNEILYSSYCCISIHWQMTMWKSGALLILFWLAQHGNANMFVSL